MHLYFCVLRTYISSACTKNGARVYADKTSLAEDCENMYYFVTFKSYLLLVEFLTKRDAFYEQSIIMNAHKGRMGKR